MHPLIGPSISIGMAAAALVFAVAATRAQRQADKTLKAALRLEARVQRWSAALDAQRWDPETSVAIPWSDPASDPVADERALMDAYGAEEDPSDRLVREAKEGARMISQAPGETIPTPGYQGPVIDGKAFPIPQDPSWAEQRPAFLDPPIGELEGEVADAEVMADPVMMCPRCKLVVEVEGVALKPGTEHEHWLACPRCSMEMRSSEWDMTVQERPCPIGGTRPTFEEYIRDGDHPGRYWDGGFHWCLCGTIAEWTGNPDEDEAATVSRHALGRTPERIRR